MLIRLSAMTPSPTHRCMPSSAMVATASQSMPSFDHADAPFAADAPALPAPKPALPFIRASRRRLRPAPRQDDASHAAVGGRLFVGRGAEAAIAGRQIRRAAEDRLMAVQGRRPQRHIRGAPRVHLVGVMI